MSRRSAGFTLLEVAIAGAILLGGLAVLAQLVRTTLQSTVSGSDGLIMGPVVDQQFKINAAHIKGRVRAVYNESSPIRLASESIYTILAPRSGYILGPAVGYGNKQYALVDVEITAKVMIGGATSTIDPVVGYTRFFKHHALGVGDERSGL